MLKLNCELERDMFQYPTLKHSFIRISCHCNTETNVASGILANPYRESTMQAGRRMTTQHYTFMHRMNWPEMQWGSYSRWWPSRSQIPATNSLSCPSCSPFSQSPFCSWSSRMRPPKINGMPTILTNFWPLQPSEARRGSFCHSSIQYYITECF